MACAGTCYLLGTKNTISFRRLCSVSNPRFILGHRKASYSPEIAAFPTRWLPRSGPILPRVLALLIRRVSRVDCWELFLEALAKAACMPVSGYFIRHWKDSQRGS